MNEPVTEKFYCSEKTEHGAKVELHASHFEPLLEIVREAKSRANRNGCAKRGYLLREVEFRLSQASRAAGNTMY